MNPSRRDSNRTQADFLAILAHKAKREGITEDRFVAQFSPKYWELARKAYQEDRQCTIIR